MLTVITGPMFAGKTSALISMCMSHVIAGDKVVVYRPRKDNRHEGNFIVSHNLEKFACVVVDREIDIYKHVKQTKPEVVAIDEAQFFAPNQLCHLIEDLIEGLCEPQIKRIICGGLSQDCWGDPFGAMPELLSIADDIVALKAVCSKCKGIGIASRTYRKLSENTDQILVGGADKYEARCFKCWKS